eukprot:748402-Hanusia_phi.AAC.1
MWNDPGYQGTPTPSVALRPRKVKTALLQDPCLPQYFFFIPERGGGGVPVGGRSIHHQPASSTSEGMSQVLTSSEEPSPSIRRSLPTQLPAHSHDRQSQ